MEKDSRSKKKFTLEKTSHLNAPKSEESRVVKSASEKDYSFKTKFTLEKPSFLNPPKSKGSGTSVKSDKKKDSLFKTKFTLENPSFLNTSKSGESSVVKSASEKDHSFKTKFSLEKPSFLNPPKSEGSETSVKCERKKDSLFKTKFTLEKPSLQNAPKSEESSAVKSTSEKDYCFKTKFTLEKPSSLNSPKSKESEIINVKPASKTDSSTTGFTFSIPQDIDISAIFQNKKASPIIKFTPAIGYDRMTIGVKTRLQCISSTLEYYNNSFEEVRLEYYEMKKMFGTVDEFDSQATTQEKITLSDSNLNILSVNNNSTNYTPLFGTARNTECKKDLIEEKHCHSVETSTQTNATLCTSKLFQRLEELLISGKHSDMTLNVNGKEFRVHKNIMACQSPVFSAMIEHEIKEKFTSIVNIEDCNPDDFSDFLHFMYTGNIDNLNTTNVQELYTIANKYEVCELSKICINYMMNNNLIENMMLY